MNWKPFILGTAIGILGGYAVKQVLSQKETISSEKALEDVRNHFKKIGPINGSWILSQPQPYEKENTNYSVYKGGISKVVNGVTKQYEFTIDAIKGTLLEVHPSAE